MAAAGRVIGTTNLMTTQNIQFGHLTGLICLNNDNPGSSSNPKCWDYEVRFCCPRGNILKKIGLHKMSINFDYTLDERRHKFLACHLMA